MIKIINVKKNFKRRKLFQDLNLEIPLNQITFILGKSGSGKSTILNMLGSIEKVDEGQILLETEDQTINLLDKKNLFLVDYIFQDYNLLKDLSAIENIRVGNNVIGKDFNKEETYGALEKFNFNKQSYKNKAHSLSGGEQQRIAVLRTLSRDSQILLVDEPTGNLDSENSKIIFNTLREISKTRTVIVVTHDVKNAETYGDNIVKIRDGRIESFEKLKGEVAENKAIITDSQEATKHYKWGNKWKILPGLVISDIKKKWIQTSMIIFTFIIALFSLVIFSLFLFTSFNLRAQSIISSNADIVFVKNNVKPPVEKDKNNFFSSDTSKPFTADEVEKIKAIKESGVNQIFFPNTIINSSRDPRSDHGVTGYFTFIYGDKKLSKGFYRFEQVNSDSFFENRIATLDRVTGDYIKNDNDIILSKTIADKLEINDPIGKKITINFLPNDQIITRDGKKTENNYDNTFEQEFNIVGILNPVKSISIANKRRGDVPKEKPEEIPVFENYISVNALDKFEQLFKEKKQLYGRLASNSSNPQPGASFSRSKVEIKQLSSSETLEEGVLPTQINEIAISSSLKKEYEEELKTTSIINSFVTLKPSVGDDIRNLPLTWKTVKIVGIVNNPEAFIYTTKATIDNLLSGISLNTAEIYTSPYVNFKDLKAKLNAISPNFNVINNGDVIRKRIYDQTFPLIIIGIIVFSLMGLICFVLVLTYSKLLVDGKKREIGILRLLGGKSLQVLSYHLANLMVINVLSLVLLSIFFYPILLIVNKIVDITELISTNIGPLVMMIIICWLVFSMFNLIIYGLISLQTFRQPVKNLLY